MRPQLPSHHRVVICGKKKSVEKRNKQKLVAKLIPLETLGSLAIAIKCMEFDIRQYERHRRVYRYLVKPLEKA